MSAVTAVCGHRRPLVIEDAGSRLAGIHHWLDGQHHTFAQPGAVTAGSEVRHLRFFVQPRTNAMSDKLPDDTETGGFDKFLDSRPNIANRVTDASRLDGAIEGSFGNFQQLAQLRSYRIIHRHRDRRIAIISVENDAAIDRNNIAGT